MSLYYFTEDLGALHALGRKRRTPRWMKRIGPYAAGAAAVLVTQKLISPGVKSLWTKWKAYRKAARTRKEMEEAERFRKLLQKTSPELFVQQPGMPTPAELQAAMDKVAAGRPVRIITPPPVPRPEVPVKPPIPVWVKYGGVATAALTVLKVLKVI